MPLPDAVAKLIETFANNEADYTRLDFKEAQLRQQFLDPFFSALGWDIDNAAGYAEAYKEVVHEESVRIGGESKAPDYSFRIGGQRKFFVEAKKPSVAIKDDPAPAFQLRRYSWSAGLQLGVLASFREIAVYDTRIRPSVNDKASIARLFYWRYTELAEKWEEFAGLFAKEAVLKGAFDRFVDGKRGKRGTSEFDVEFLRDMENWRELLARNIALRNPGLDTRHLNFAVQRIIDRIIFLRIAESRGIEPYGQMQALLPGAAASNVSDESSGWAASEEPPAYGGSAPRRQTIYPRLCEIFGRADLRYNSGLFHFGNERDRTEPPDRLTPALFVDDAVLRQIIRDIYWPSPYEFKEIQAPILGSIYERFLGKTIRLTEGHRAVIDEKPEVRKAGGVYYTPDYIVDYIVRQTLDPLLERKTPAQVEKLKVLDPACGSGAFLVGAYQYLLDWHQNFYATHDPQKWARRKHPPVYETSPNAHGLSQGNGNWQLTTEERKRILTANIHGVDIDAQAVEVTKLALLLKVLEGRARETQGGYQMDFHRILPDLGKNIQCGNSLVGHDFYQQLALPDLDDDDKYKLNTFEWRDAFPEVMRDGGFDAVIGNPPYVRIQTLQESQPEAAEYLNAHYAAAAKGNYDIYVCFIEKALSLLNPDGRLGYIVPHKFFNAEYGEALREHISKGSHILGIVHFGHQQIFEGATTYTAILRLAKKPLPHFLFESVDDLELWQEKHKTKRIKIEAKSVTSSPWNFVNKPTARLRDKLAKKGKLLGEIADIFVGLQTSADDVYVLEQPSQMEKRVLRPFLATDELRPYSPARANAWLLFPYQIENARAQLIPAAQFQKDFPHAWSHLKEHQKRLKERERGKWKNDNWYAFGRSQNLTKMTMPKLIIQVTALRPTVILDEAGLHMTGGGSGPFYGIRPVVDDYSLLYLLAILNSKMFGWIVRGQSTVLRGGYIKFSKQYIETAPIPSVSQPVKDHIEKLASTMLRCRLIYDTTKTPHEQTRLQHEITAINRQIDALVYQLYNLTDSEIALVEQASG